MRSKIGIGVVFLCLLLVLITQSFAAQPIEVSCPDMTGIWDWTTNWVAYVPDSGTAQEFFFFQRTGTFTVEGQMGCRLYGETVNNQNSDFNGPLTGVIGWDGSVELNTGPILYRGVIEKNKGNMIIKYSAQDMKAYIESGKGLAIKSSQ